MVITTEVAMDIGVVATPSSSPIMVGKITNSGVRGTSIILAAAATEAFTEAAAFTAVAEGMAVDTVVKAGPDAIDTGSNRAVLSAPFSRAKLLGSSVLGAFESREDASNYFGWV
jgi:hypothetical protein